MSLVRTIAASIYERLKTMAFAEAVDVRHAFAPELGLQELDAAQAIVITVSPRAETRERTGRALTQHTAVVHVAVHARARDDDRVAQLVEFVDALTDELAGFAPQDAETPAIATVEPVVLDQLLKQGVFASLIQLTYEVTR